MDKIYDYEFLVVLKNLANDSLHTKAADVSALAENQHDGLYQASEISIAQLLKLIYERPKEDREVLAKLKSGLVRKGQK